MTQGRVPVVSGAGGGPAGGAGYLGEGPGQLDLFDDADGWRGCPAGRIRP